MSFISCGPVYIGNISKIILTGPKSRPWEVFPFFFLCFTVNPIVWLKTLYDNKLWDGKDLIVFVLWGLEQHQKLQSFCLNSKVEML